MTTLGTRINHIEEPIIGWQGFLSHLTRLLSSSVQNLVDLDLKSLKNLLSWQSLKLAPQSLLNDSADLSLVLFERILNFRHDLRIRHNILHSYREAILHKPIVYDVLRI